MTQQNNRTHRLRNIRRVATAAPPAYAATAAWLTGSGSGAASASASSAGAGGGGGGMWEVELEHYQGGWTAYDAMVQQQISSAITTGQTKVTTSMRGQTYELNLRKQTQTNKHTGFKRKLRCTGGAAAAPPPAPAASASFASGGGGGGLFGGLFGTGGGIFPAGTRSPSCVRSGSQTGDEVLTFDAGDGVIDYATVTEWTVLQPNVDYDPKQTCDISADELGDGTMIPVVRLSCATPSIDCVFRQDVIESSLKSNPQCPKCSYRHTMPGSQPSGTMRVKRTRTRCEGYTCGTWNVDYHFPDGTQTALHPNSGTHFSGTSRHCHYPDDAEGRELVEMLKRGFERGHLFIIGKSTTTGQDNTTIWASVHQKTSTGGGPTSHGWPDAAYFGRVRNELAAKGLFDLATEQQQRDELAQRKQARLTATSSSSASASSASASASGAAAAAGGGGGAASGTDDAERARIQSELSDVAEALKAAMKAGERDKIRELMAARTKLQADMKALDG
mmetsp:Transcript_99249/g.283929  ORF Transcript_99249/g.283929 Transcript_99249/m.283929 type:complete len:504 (-) Transcript_99249:207-1718(-)